MRRRISPRTSLPFDSKSTMSEMLHEELLGGWEVRSRLKILLILWKVEGMDVWVGEWKPKEKNPNIII